MIPKVIHYCWFGRNPLPKSAQKCIASWRKFLPDYEIKEWNEDNFDVNMIPYTKQAYAASFGGEDLPEKYKSSYQKLLRRYAYISTREPSNILQKLTGKPGKVVLDPTFLLRKTDWVTIIPKEPLIKGAYILCYLLRYSFDPFPYAEKVIQFVKKKTGMKVVMIGPEAIHILKGYQVMANCGPLDFLNLFYNANYVITSSFHGTSFAINFRKDFISIIDDKETSDNRQVSLIETLGLSKDCLLKKNATLGELKIPHIDYSIYEDNIENDVRQSRLFLEDALLRVSEIN